MLHIAGTCLHVWCLKLKPTFKICWYHQPYFSPEILVYCLATRHPEFQTGHLDIVFVVAKCPGSFSIMLEIAPIMLALCFMISRISINIITASSFSHSLQSCSVSFLSNAISIITWGISDHSVVFPQFIFVILKLGSFSSHISFSCFINE